MNPPVIHLSQTDQKQTEAQMSITVKEVDKTYFPLYDQVSMNVDVKSEYRVNRVNGGLGGFVFEETPVTPLVKDLSKYERAVDYEKMFDISTWRFFMAFDGEKPVGGMTVAGPTQGMDMMGGRNDACVLWDIRVEDGYKHMGIGQKMLVQGIAAAKADGYRTMIIECQNNNVPACNFYRKQGALLSKIDMNAYDSEPEIADEVQFVWHLEL